VARVLDLCQPGFQAGAHGQGRVIHPKLEPRAKPGAIFVGAILDEFDAEVPTTREVDEQHGHRHSGMLDRPHRPAAQRSLEAPHQVRSPRWTSKDMCVVPGCNHDTLRLTHIFEGHAQTAREAM